MKSIAFVCAFAPAFNTGMLSVDLAAKRIANQLTAKSDIKIDFLNVEQQHRAKASVEADTISYGHCTSQKSLHGYDRIVYWGDFLHSRYYQRKDMSNRFEQRFGSAEAGAAEYKEALACLTLQDAPLDVLQKTICFGNALYGIEARDDRDRAYQKSLFDIYSNGRLVMLRDPISAFYAARASQWKRHDTLGIDCAFLLDPKDGWKGKPHGRTKKRVGYSFGRHLSKNPTTAAVMLDVINQLTEVHGCEVVNLEWLKVNRAAPIDDFKKKLDTVISCDFVITDTYHCALNSWREGVPAICMSRGADNSSGTLQEKKKEYLYSMFNARDFILYIENLAAWGMEETLNRILQLTAAHDNVAVIRKAMQQSAAHCKGRLLEALDVDAPPL